MGEPARSRRRSCGLPSARCECTRVRAIRAVRCYRGRETRTESGESEIFYIRRAAPRPVWSRTIRRSSDTFLATASSRSGPWETRERELFAVSRSRRKYGRVARRGWPGSQRLSSPEVKSSKFSSPDKNRVFVFRIFAAEKRKSPFLTVPRGREASSDGSANPRTARPTLRSRVYRRAAPLNGLIFVL